MGAPWHARECPGTRLRRDRPQSRILQWRSRADHDSPHSSAASGQRPGSRWRAAAAGFRCLSLHDRFVHCGGRRASAVHALTSISGAHVEGRRNGGVLMDFNLSEKGENLRRKIRDFVNEVLIPLESDPASFDEHENISKPLLEEMRARARAEGLWALQMPESRGGQGCSMVEMAACYE